MEWKKEKIEMMDNMMIGSSSFSDQFSGYPLSSIFDSMPLYDHQIGGGDQKGGGGSLGFMDLLGIQDFNPIFDLLQQQPPSSSVAPPPPPPVLPPLQTSLPPPSTETSEVLNMPATPNSSSISSSSNEANNNNDEQQQQHTKGLIQAEDHHQDEEKTKSKQLKPNNNNKKPKNQKKQREPRFAFMTKSEVDHLEDGYRWRKYGQKAVKNSPFPRSYYRCTFATCGVKKRVERSCEDPTIVVTTYEGQHTHPSPVMPRGSSIGIDSVGGGGYGASSTSSFVMPHRYQQSPYFHSLPPPLNFSSTTNTTTTNSTTSSPSHLRATERRFCTSPSASSTSSLLRDYGLLQDIVPSDMRKEG